MLAAPTRGSGMMEFRCAECNKILGDEIPLLVDGKGLFPLDFCSWECLMGYVIKKHNQEQPTSSNSALLKEVK